MPTTNITPVTPGAQVLTFAERRAKLVEQENAWQQYNSEAPFYTEDMIQSLEKLANKTFPTDSFNSNAYQEAIVESLSKTISPEVGILDFWKAMGKAGCQNLLIEDGHLNFYTKNHQKIDITHYTQPIVFEAHSSYYRQRQLDRENRILEARKQLQELLKEIHKH